MTRLFRLRVAFVVLAIGLLVPLALLIRRALESERAERTSRHQLVAERIVDEMERELTAFLRNEEDRPFEHYRRLAYRAGGGTSGPETSPLAEPPAQPFVLGYFQIEPDGVVTTPREGTSESERRRLAELADTVRDHWRRADPGRLRTAATAREEELEGEELQKLEDPFEAKSRAVPLAAPESTLSQLNRGASERQQRRAKLSQTPAANVYGSSEEPPVARSAPTAESAAVSADDAREADAEEAFLDESAPLTGADRTPVDLRVEPMVGNPVDDARMVLYRTVVVDSEGYRQGMLVDSAELVRWLESRVVGTQGLASRVRVLWRDAETGPSAYRFRHDFAEPFSPVTATLDLQPLPELSGSRYLAALAALLVLAATVGLFAAYRMAAVAVAYSVRRQNFVSAVSHELKTPLTAIRMYGEMLRDDLVPTEEKRRHYYEVITSETERLTRLVNNVLELSRLERREPTMRPARGDIAPVVEETVTLFTPHAETEGFHVVVELAPDLPEVRFDRDGLAQVLFNLLDNAVKYSKRASRREVIVTVTPADGGACIEVRDFGPGVPAGKLERIFEPFYRDESELTRTAKGTGIGLSLVRGLVERMGGSVSAHTPDGGGLAVRLTLSP